MRTIRLSFPWHRVVAPLLCLPGVYRPWAGGCPGSTGRQGHPPPRAGQLRQPGRPGPQALRPGPNLGPDHPRFWRGVTSAPEAEAILQANLGLLTQTAQASHRSSGVRLFRLGPSGGNLVPHPAIPGRGPSPPGTTRPCGCSSVRRRGTTGGA